RVHDPVMPEPSHPRSYRVREFAALTGVTVRTLHHYDRAGLLKPRRTRAGYRLYRDADLPRVQQILVLRFLGLPLVDMADALKRESRLDDLLKTRRYAIKRKRQHLALLLDLLDELLEKPAAQENWADLASYVRGLGGRRAPEGSWERRRLDEARRLV